MSRFEFFPTPISDLYVVERMPMRDERGSLERIFCADEFLKIGLLDQIKQINLVVTKDKSVVRGMHFQYPPHAEAKFVTCIRGKIYDVAIDIRRESPTFLHWHGEELSAENSRSLFLPKGFAHGYQTLTEDCEMIYLHSNSYQIESEGALNAEDPLLDIRWPLPITGLSDRDRNHANINDDFLGVTL